MAYCKIINSWADEDNCPKINDGKIIINRDGLKTGSRKYKYFWEYCKFMKCRNASKDCEICSILESISNDKLIKLGKYFLCEECKKTLEKDIVLTLRKGYPLTISCWYGKHKKTFFNDVNALGMEAVTCYQVFKASYRHPNANSKYITVFIY